MKLCPVILAGGGGTRLWPLSRAYYPKQFLKLFGEKTMLQETLTRLDGLDKNIQQHSPLLVCNEEHRFLVAEQANQINCDIQSIILEPEGRNTAPALTIAAHALLETMGDVVMVMMPADHVIIENEKFLSAISAGYQMALEDYLITFGIKPGHPETGYGYIQCGKVLDSENHINNIHSFKEKPDLELAKEYITSGEYLWNSGIFMMKASVWCNEIEKLQPEIFTNSKQAYDKGTSDNLFYHLDKQSFLSCKNDSIDYAMMEKLTEEQGSRTCVVALDAGWSDIGAWSAVWELDHQDELGNVTNGDVILGETKNSLVKSEHRLVATLGCKNMVIIETADAVLVADKEKSQEIKNVVEHLNKQDREERLTHRRVYRPWGYYETIDSGKNFQVKRITVEPGKKLSLQLHYKRTEHWVVVEGIATVTKGDEVFELHKDESTYIPVEVKHRLENTTQKPLEIIEVQSGSYLGEDDIERFDDDFGRIGK